MKDSRTMATKTAGKVPYLGEQEGYVIVVWGAGWLILFKKLVGRDWPKAAKTPQGRIFVRGIVRTSRRRAQISRTTILKVGRVSEAFSEDMDPE